MESVSHLPLFNTIIAYLDDDQVEQLTLTTRGLLGAATVAEKNPFYWKERVELLFGKQLADRPINWEETYKLLSKPGAFIGNQPTIEAFEAVGKAGNYDALWLLLDTYFGKIKLFIGRAFRAAADNGHFNMTTRMIKDGLIVPPGYESKSSMSILLPVDIIISYLDDDPMKVLIGLGYPADFIKHAISVRERQKREVEKEFNVGELSGRLVNWYYVKGVLEKVADHGRGDIDYVELTKHVIKEGNLSVFNVVMEALVRKQEGDELESTLAQIASLITDRKSPMYSALQEVIAEYAPDLLE